MKQVFTLIALTLLLATTNSSAQCTSTDLVFAAYVEGSSNNKVIEIFNGTASAINLAAGTYTVRVYANGSVSPTSIALTGTIPSNGRFRLANSSASAAILANASQTSGSLSFNGDDALSIAKAGTNIDIFGVIGTDPGTAWTGGGCSTLDRSLLRNTTSGTCPVDVNGADAFDPSVWTAGGACAAVNDLTVLPVEITLLTVKKALNKSIVSWSTVSEEDNAAFNIERSNDGAIFQKIGTVKGNGTTNAVSNYTFEDATPSVGTNYYRLNQIDANGAATLSKVVSIQFGGKKGDLKVFPTLAFDRVTVLTNSDKEENFTISNLLGQTVVTGRITNASDVTISQLTKGMYILKVAGETVKFSKQ